ncbi:uncharacterized protein LOC124349352 [Daphnia pulicaria]|uniref:uncharacterized protein LOC124349352 n=1 Tax=Daphnia pulicaria TaxID=35523 RepID=UPI001EEADD1E|nr:uncharacterized protein LOC124349352 [Daphnia pulicaria]
MESDPESAPKSQGKIRSNFLLTCSIINILISSLCERFFLEDSWRPLIGQNKWGSITYIVAGLLGFSASYKPTRPIIISTTVFSSLSICFALISGCITLAQGFSQCPTTYFPSPSGNNGVCYFQVKQLVLAIVNLVSFVNNVIVIVLLSRVFVCKCCLSADSSVPVQLVVQNPPQPTPMWVIPPDGQQPQLQSHPTVVYSPYQLQPVPQQEQQQWQTDQHQHPPGFMDHKDPICR